MGDRLVVALTVDEYVNKPGRPIIPWVERASLLRALKCVDAVVASKSAASAINVVRPQILVKGCDYEDSMPDGDIRICVELGVRIVITRTPKYSTTALIEKIRASA